MKTGAAGPVFAFCDSPALFPPYVAQVSARIAEGTPSEAAIGALGVRVPSSLERAVPRRRLEFAAGRRCAVRALAAALPGWSGEIATAADRAPCWPDGVAGSITHAGGFTSAAVARTTLVRGVGLDSERIVTAEIRRSVADVVVNASDRAPPTALGLSAEIAFTLLFSAKESVFKCLYPIVRRMFFFEHVAVTLDPRPGRFHATLLTDLGDDLRAGRALEGRYVIADPFVHTGIVLEAAATDAAGAR